MGGHRGRGQGRLASRRLGLTHGGTRKWQELGVQLNSQRAEVAEILFRGVPLSYQKLSKPSSIPINGTDGPERLETSPVDLRTPSRSLARAPNHALKELDTSDSAVIV